MVILRFVGFVMYGILKAIVFILQIVLTLLSSSIGFVGGIISFFGGMLGAIFVVAGIGTLLTGISSTKEFWGMMIVGIAFGVIPNLLRELGQQGIEGIIRVLRKI